MGDCSTTDGRHCGAGSYGVLSVSSDPSGSSLWADGGGVAAAVGTGLDVEPAAGFDEREDADSGAADDVAAAVGWRVELVVSSVYLARVLEVVVWGCCSVCERCRF